MAELQKIIEEIRMALQADGADLELLQIKQDGTPVIKISGRSKGCDLMGVSIESAVEQYIKRANSKIHSIETL